MFDVVVVIPVGFVSPVEPKIFEVVVVVGVLPEAFVSMAEIPGVVVGVVEN